MIPHCEGGHQAAGGPKILTVSAAEAGQKLVQYLGRVLGPEIPGSVFMRWIRTGQVRVDGKRAKPFDRVEQGQAVRLPPFAELAAGRMATPGAGIGGRGDSGPQPGQPSAATPTGQAGAELADKGRNGGAKAPTAVEGRNSRGGGLDILAETDRWLVIAKPSGLPVHPGSGWTDSVQTRLNDAYAGSPFIPTLVHRLDRDTSGLLLAAKTHRALTAAHEAIRQGEATKRYLCWVRGRWTLSPLGEAIVLEDRLEKAGPAGKEKMQAGGAGKTARLEAVPLVVEEERTLLAVRLFTGRTHQIRVQLSSRGHPIAGDAKYGGGQSPLYLHAWKLALLGEAFQCPPPWTGPWAAPTNLSL